MSDIYESVGLNGLNRILFEDEASAVAWGKLVWNYYLVTFSSFEGDRTFDILVEAADPKSAVAVAYDFLAREGEDFVLPASGIIEITILRNVYAHIAQTAFIEKPGEVMRLALSELVEV